MEAGKCPHCAANYGLPLTPARCQDDLLVGGGVEGTNTFRFSATAGEGDFPTLADLVACFDGAALDTNNDFGSGATRRDRERGDHAGGIALLGADDLFFIT